MARVYHIVPEALADWTAERVWDVFQDAKGQKIISSK